jgi:hypothetical protein
MRVLGLLVAVATLAAVPVACKSVDQGTAISFPAASRERQWLESA